MAAAAEHQLTRADDARAGLHAPVRTGAHNARHRGVFMDSSAAGVTGRSQPTRILQRVKVKGVRLEQAAAVAGSSQHCAERLAWCRLRCRGRGASSTGRVGSGRSAMACTR